MNRPWKGETEPAGPSVPDFDPSCYLCPGRTRSSGAVNPAYDGTFIFENDFPAVTEEKTESDSGSGVLKTEGVSGKCYVICYSGKHNETMSSLPVSRIMQVIDAWASLCSSISRDYPFIRSVQIWESKGEMMGCSCPHPHGQSWALSYVPTQLARQLSCMTEYSKSHSYAKTLISRNHLLIDYVTQELKAPGQPRVLYENDHFVVLVPYWADWPFKTMILPKLFNSPFPYTMGIFQSPTVDSEYLSVSQLHIVFSPPLLRSASVKKFVTGFDMFFEMQRDLTPEAAAEKLKALS